MNHIHDTTALGACPEAFANRSRAHSAFAKRVLQKASDRGGCSGATSGVAQHWADFSREMTFHSLTHRARHDSQDWISHTKLLYQTAAGHLIESVVLRIASGRTSLCVSSQVGCAVQCRFCTTGQMGITLNLSRDEILDQVIQANPRDTCRRPVDSQRSHHGHG